MAAECGNGGVYQRRVERWLRLKADGRQSAADCRAIRAFQRKHGVEPATGEAGAATWARMRKLSAGAARGTHGCPARSYRVACVDLDHQRTWVQQRGRVVFGPVPMRSGGLRHPTRTGWFRIFWRHRHHWSTLYNSPMPYAQFFSGGQAFHAVRGSIRTVGGSMGCVNLRLADARGLWKALRTGDHVYVWGRRPRR
ncbi:L,D-transpeptidase family protein [Streptomyces aureus]